MDEGTLIGPRGERRSVNAVQAATRVARIAVGDITDEVPHRRFILEVEPSGEPPRKPVSEIELSREDLDGR